MINKYFVQEKTKEEALKNLLENTNEQLKDLYILEEIEEGKLFKSSKIKLTGIKKQDIINYLKDYIKEMSNLMNIDIMAEIKEKEDIINIILLSNNNNILIGKDGRTLNAIQNILKQMIKINTNLNIRIYVDVSNYKARKVQNVEYEVRKIAEEVIKSKIEVKLDPMNSYERRVVHSIVGEFENLKTESFGEEPNRYTVIKYKDKE